MNVVFDTCAVYPDLLLRGTQFEVLLSSASRLGITIVEPQLVVDELINKHRESLATLKRDWRKIGAETKRLFGKDVVAPQVPWEKDSFDYSEYLTTFLRKHNCKFLPYPSIPHADVVQAIFAKRHPFHGGEYGYRDYVMWQSILEFFRTANEKIVFVTSNTKDFGSGTLAEAYVTDLQRLRPDGSIALFQTLAAFNEMHVLPTLKRLDELAAQFNANTHAGFSVRNWASEYLLGYIEDNDYESGFSPLHPDHASVSITNWEVRGTRVCSVLHLGNNNIIVRALSDVHALRTIRASDYQFEHADVREFFPGSRGESFACWTEQEMDGSVAFSLILDADASSLIDVEIDRITAEGSTAYTDVGKNW
jgi:PIN domain